MKMDKDVKLNTTIGILLIIGSFIIIIISPDFNGLFIATIMALIAFLILKNTQVILKNQKEILEKK